MGRNDGVLALWLCACVLLALGPTLLPHRVLIQRDLTYFVHPWRTFGAEAIIRGECPLWNPYQRCGIPFLANFQSAIVYPLSLPFYVFPFTWALKIFHVFHLCVACLGVYGLMRKIQTAPIPAACAAVSFGLGGVLMTRLELISHLGTLVWGPLLWLFTSAPIVWGIVLACAVCGGYPQAILWQFLAYLPIGFFLNQPWRKMIVAVTGGGTIGLLLSAPQGLPGREMILHAERFLQGLPLANAATHSFAWQGLLGILGPQWTQSSLFAFPKEVSFWAYTFYVGVLATAFILIGLAVLPLRKRLVAILYLGTVLAIVLGTTTPVFPWLYRYVFVFRIIRFPGPWIYVALPQLFLLVGAGVGWFAHRARYSGRSWISGLVLTGVSVELIIYAWCLHVTSTPRWYSSAFQGPFVAYLEKTLAGYRYVLSPKADARIAEDDWGKTWGKTIDVRFPFRVWLFENINLPSHLANVKGNEALAPLAIQRYLDRVTQVPSVDGAVPWLSLASVKILATPEETQTTLLVPRGKTLWHIFENPGVFPRAYWVNGQDYHDLQTRWPQAFRTVTPYPLGWQGLSEHHVRVQGPFHRGWVVLTDADFPGWQAFLDGRSVPIHPLQGVFRSIEITRSGHTIDFVYRPWSFRLGLVCFLGTLSTLVLYGVRHR